MISKMTKRTLARRRGYWFTTEKGQHLFAEEGETPKEACERYYAERERKEEKIEEIRRKVEGSTVTERQDVPSRRGKSKTEEDFFGVEFVGYKDNDAIEKLLKERKGHIKNAFYRDEIGGVDLVWGDDSGGLFHTIKRRDAFYKSGIGSVSGETMVKMIPDIINEGDFGIGKNERPYFSNGGFMVIIKPTYDGKKLNWVLSAMEEIKKSR